MGALDATPIEVDEYAGQVVRVVEHVDTAFAQRGVDHEGDGTDLDGGSLCVNGAACVQTQDLVEQYGVDTPHLGFLQQSLPAIQRWLTRLGVRASVVALLEPGAPEGVEFLERRGLGAKTHLDLERLLDRPVEALDDATAFADVRLAVAQVDA